MADVVARELAELRTSVDRLTQGLQLTTETLGGHSEMLRRILVAATEPTPEGSDLGRAIAQFAAMLRQYGETQTAIRWEINRLREDVLTAVTGRPPEPQVR